MCIGTPAMIANLKNNANNTPKKILKPVRQVEGKKIIAKTIKTLTILEVLNTFLIKAKTENGGKVRLGTQAFISILKHSKNCRYVPYVYTLGKKSSIYPKIHILKISFFTKFTFCKSHF